ncbi:MAG: hypothetical protein CVV64_03095 [Candidatus Wallbacteria bacterium HGW-Wallbacteria-1]|uniref:Carboxypeptidase regulatory-like domain-containing protein n=1 Tax=Candidatus Wallbacteria bacterium HGW-Wallbacteria-1 TaxID=2013854 RepID=A0A2N1PTM4_9BACT|nr:MAG: hypothetical protein CVV64_03095 [Candidatus Wallbacteria bacterium HGW-Wallbacteria-1]
MRFLSFFIGILAAFFMTGCDNGDLLDQLTGMSSDGSSGIIRGTVSIPYSQKTGDASGSIVVTLLNTRISTECDSEGRFSLTEVPAGKYTLLASLGDTYKAIRSEVSVETDGVSEVDNFYLGKTGRITGTVYIDGAEDHSGVTVRETSTDIEVITDSLGNYALEALPAGIWTISFSKAGVNDISRSNVAVTSDATTQLSRVVLSAIGAVTDILYIETSDTSTVGIAISDRGDRLAVSYRNPVSGNSDIGVANLDGTDFSLAVSSYLDDLNPCWSDSDNSIVYSRGGSLFSMALASAADTLLIQGGTSGHWNPANSSLLHVLNGGIWVRPADTEGEADVSLTNIGTHPRQEINSGKVIFCRGSEIWLMDSEGNNQTLVSTEGKNPCWLSSQYEILYEWNGDIYRKNVMSSSAYKVVSGGVSPAWIPSQSRVVYYSPEDKKVRMMQL